MVTDELDYVLGVDTHRDEHVLAVVTAPAGTVVARQAVGANRPGYREALCLAERYAPGARAWAIEGAGHYGAGLARYLSERDEAVLEISRTPRAERRLRGKDDPLDAVRTARAALASETYTLPRSGERREALRLLLIARRSAVDVRREALVQLRSVIVTAPDRLRDELRELPVGRLLARAAAACHHRIHTRAALRAPRRASLHAHRVVDTRASANEPCHFLATLVVCCHRENENPAFAGFS
jgi:transposase